MNSAHSVPDKFLSTSFCKCLFRSAFFLLYSLTFIAGCDKMNSGPSLSSPSGVLQTYFISLKKGDQETLKKIMLDGEGVSPLAFGMAKKLANKRGYLSCSETINGDKAFVKGTFANGEIINAILIKDGEIWKIDIIANEDLVPGSFLKERLEKLTDSEKKNEKSPAPDKDGENSK